MSILETLSNQNADVAEGVTACGSVMMKLMHPEGLEMEEEIKLVTSLVEFADAFAATADEKVN